MGCNNTKDIQNTVGQKQLLVQISDKLKNYKQEFKSYSEFHRIDEVGFYPYRKQRVLC